MATRRSLVATALAVLAACQPVEPPRPRIVGDPGRGRAMMQEVGCHACHVIPGVRGPAGLLGPPLAGYSHNIYVAGKFPGTPDVLVRWIRDAPSLAPGTAMPESPVSEAEARDMAAYLYSLE